MDTSQGFFALVQKVFVPQCLYQARKQHGECNKSLYHRADAVLLRGLLYLYMNSFPLIHQCPNLDLLIPLFTKVIVNCYKKSSA